jgi:hypothetical protein
MLDALHLAFVDCDQLRVQVTAHYDVGEMQRPTVSQAHHVVAWMAADSPDGNREDVISHCVDVVAITLRNTIVGKISRGLVKLIQSLVKPQQPNQICIDTNQLHEYLRTVTLPASIASTAKFKARPNVSVGGLNTTDRPQPGYMPRGTLSQAAPMFKRIPTQFLVADSAETCSVEKSPSAGTSLPSTTSPPSDFTEDSLLTPVSPSSDAAPSLNSPGGSMGARPALGSEASLVALVEESTVGPPKKASFFSWLSCSCVAPTATTAADPA